MKLIKFLLIMSAFLIMVAAIFNLLYSGAETPDRTGVYIELVVMFILMISMVLLSNVEKKMKQLEDKKDQELE
ncbi:hypothetical protein [Marinifilum caeruleilacunae]|uniref:CcmD family protein n=1 Tax=Marinifilum caeruleilacunae TaxID=2499076 RepID=A0ABX1WVA2_9BACT|nr:hypothetical protein [Marinifilum caeruleilacunae]NOU60033.1 hypothetical protein [Marinifilum caeruleilacunae]